MALPRARWNLRKIYCCGHLLNPAEYVRQQNLKITFDAEALVASSRFSRRVGAGVNAIVTPRAMRGGRDSAIEHPPMEKSMRHKLLTVTILTLASAAATPVFAPALASQKPSTAAANWGACYDLGMARGVHLENNEMPGFVEECLAGNVPFGNETVKVARRQTHNPKASN
jgi:hypothetical protein